jgi:hypothetical protein
MSARLILLKKLIKETIQLMSESSLTSDILDSSFKNARVYHGDGFDVPAEAFKSEVEKMIKAIEDRAKTTAGKKFPGISETEKFALTDLLGRIPDSGRVGPRDIYFAKQQVESEAPSAPSTRIDMNALPSPSQVDVSKIMARLAREMPAVFGPESESDRESAYIASLINPIDKAFFSHGMEYGSTSNVRGEEKRVFPRDASGNVIRRPDGSIIHFKVQPKITVQGVLYDVYTNSFVSTRIFDNRNKVYRSMWEKGQLPSPTAMKNARTRR